MLFLGSILLFMGFGLGAQSDNCIVFGEVFEDHSGGQPIEGVHIICVENSYFSAETDANGEYLISILRNSSLRAEKSGYHISRVVRKRVRIPKMFQNGISACRVTDVFLFGGY